MYFTKLGKLQLFVGRLSQKAVGMVISAAILASLTSVSATNANGRIREWVGGDNNDSNWTSNGNWNGIGGAGANDDLVFGSQVAIFGGFAFTPVFRRVNTNDLQINTSFDSLKFSGGDYVISGNQIFLGRAFNTTGISVFASGGGAAPVFNPNIILGANQIWNCNSGTLTLNGVVNLNNHSLAVSGAGDLVMNGLINGTGDLSRSGAGTLFINGSASTHGMTLNDGDTRVTGSLGTIVPMGGTLSGTGSVAAIFGFGSGRGGTISPGNGGNTTGRLRSVGGSVVQLSPEVNLAIDLNGPTVASQYDQFRVTNTNLNLNGTNLEISLGFTPTAGQQFTIISLTGTGTITGQFDQGISILKDNQLFAITYTGNSVVLTSLGQAVP